jgi:hypothetical protein
MEKKWKLFCFLPKQEVLWLYGEVLVLILGHGMFWSSSQENVQSYPAVSTVSSVLQ